MTSIIFLCGSDDVVARCVPLKDVICQRRASTYVRFNGIAFGLAAGEMVARSFASH